MYVVALVIVKMKQSSKRRKYNGLFKKLGVVSEHCQGEL